jgi:hypothetical protein
MRRASIGTVELTSAAWTVDRDRFGAVRPGFTVGNNCDGLTGATLVPGIAGSPASGTTLDDDVAVLAAATTSVADAENVWAPLAEACAVNATFAPTVAVVDTGTETSSS